MSQQNKILVIIGAGGMGAATAHRIGTGSKVILADISEKVLIRAADELRFNGQDIETVTMDVTDKKTVQDLANKAVGLGDFHTLVHTVGLSPAQAKAEDILSVNLLGASYVLDIFGEIVAAGGSGVVIASMAGAQATLSAEQEKKLTLTPTDELMKLPEVLPDNKTPYQAYAVSKRGAQLRVEAAAHAWAQRGARINTISPGPVVSPMCTAQLQGPGGDGMRALIEKMPVGRIGTSDEIAMIVEFLTGPGAAIVTGANLYADGGIVAELHSGRMTFPMA